MTREKNFTLLLFGALFFSKYVIYIYIWRLHLGGVNVRQPETIVDGAGCGQSDHLGPVFLRAPAPLPPLRVRSRLPRATRPLRGTPPLPHSTLSASALASLSRASGLPRASSMPARGCLRPPPSPPLPLGPPPPPLSRSRDGRGASNPRVDRPRAALEGPG